MNKRVTLYSGAEASLYVITLSVSQESFLERVFVKSDATISAITIQRAIATDTDAPSELRFMNIPSGYNGGEDNFLFATSDGESNAWRFYKGDRLSIIIELEGSGNVFAEIDGIIYGSASIEELPD